MTKTKKAKIRAFVKDHRDAFEMFAWFWGANTLMAVFFIIVYKSMLGSCAII